MNNPDHISESLETIFWVKILKFFDVDPGMEKILIRDGKNSDPGRNTAKTPLSFKGRSIQVSTLNIQKILRKIQNTGTVLMIWRGLGRLYGRRRVCPSW
jgi:hypothetical protein